MRSRTATQSDKPTAEELTTTERLLVLLLLKLGATQAELAQALGVKQSTISKRFRWNVKKLTLGEVIKGR